MTRKDLTERKFVVTRIKGNRETILGVFDSLVDAKSEFQKIKGLKKYQTGAYELTRAFILPDGSMDTWNRTTIASYSPDAEQFLRNLGVRG